MHVLPHSGLVGHAHILEHLRIGRHLRAQAGERLLAVEHRLHQLDGGQDAVARGGVLAQNDVAGLLAADAVAVLHHVFVDEAVAHRRLLITDARLIERLVQAEVAHDGGHNLVAGELALAP